MWALANFTETKGGTHIVPTSNTWDADPYLAERDAMQSERLTKLK